MLQGNVNQVKGGRGSQSVENGAEGSWQFRWQLGRHHWQRLREEHMNMESLSKEHSIWKAKVQMPSDGPCRP